MVVVRVHHEGHRQEAARACPPQGRGCSRWGRCRTRDADHQRRLLPSTCGGGGGATGTGAQRGQGDTACERPPSVLKPAGPTQFARLRGARPPPPRPNRVPSGSMMESAPRDSSSSPRDRGNPAVTDTAPRKCCSHPESIRTAALARGADEVRRQRTGILGRPRPSRALRVVAAEDLPRRALPQHCLPTAPRPLPLIGAER